MKSFNISYLSIVRLFLILALCVLPWNAWGSSNKYYYAKLTVKSGKGTVYIDKDEQQSVTVNPDSSGSTKSKKSAANEQSVSFSLQAIPSDYYKFVDWRVDAKIMSTDSLYNHKVTTTSQSSDNPTPETITANFSPIEYFITFKSNGGTVNPPRKTYTFETETIDMPSPGTYSGYRFLGWKASNNTDLWGTKNYPEGSVTVEKYHGDVLFEAQWSEEYTITFDSNGGNSTPDKQTYIKEDTSVNLPSPGEKSYHDFDGWEPTNNSTWSKSRYQQGNNVISNYSGDVTLKAQWNPTKYNITYKYTDNSGAERQYTGSKEYDYTQSFHLDDAPSDGGEAYADFDGWKPEVPSECWKDQTYNGTVGPGMHGDITLVAQWSEPKDYKIIYKDGDGKETPTQYNIESVSNFPKPERLGHTFRGWKSNLNTFGWSNSLFYQPSDKFKDKYGDVTLTAQWEAETYDITYFLDDGTFKEDDIIYSYTITSEDKFPEPSKTGNEFLGWKVSGDGLTGWDTNHFYLPTETFKEKTGDVTLTAQWTPVYTITYKYTDDEGVEQTETKEYNETQSVTLKTKGELQNAGSAYEKFVGWKPESSVENWSNEMTYSGTLDVGQKGDVILVAKWSDPKEYTLTYKFKDGDKQDSLITYTIESNDKLISPSRFGYRFNNWQVTSDSLGTWKKGNTFSADSEHETLLKGKWGNVVLEANWILADAYQINYFDEDEKTPFTDISPTSYTIETEDSMQSPTKLGYDFKGWKVMKDSGNWKKDEIILPEKLDDKPLFGKWGDVDFVVIWEAHNYQINYDLQGGTLKEDDKINFYTITSEDKFPEPSKTGNEFLGWKVSGDGLTGWDTNHFYLPTETFEGNTGDVKLTAQWSSLPGYIKIIVNGLEDQDSAIFDVTWARVNKISVSVGSGDAESGIIVMIPSVGEKTMVKVAPNTVWSRNYPDMNSPLEKQVQGESHKKASPCEFSFDAGVKSATPNVSETYKEF